MTNDRHELTPDKVTKVNDLMVIDKSDSVTRADAIERVKGMNSDNWHKSNGFEHLKYAADYDQDYWHYSLKGAIAELINLFSITEEELK